MQPGWLHWKSECATFCCDTAGCVTVTQLFFGRWWVPDTNNAILELTAREFEVTDVAVERVEGEVHATADDCHIAPDLVVDGVFAADL